MTDLSLCIYKLLLLSLPLPVSLRSHLLITVYMPDLVKPRDTRYYHNPKKDYKINRKDRMREKCQNKSLKLLTIIHKTD